MRTMRQKIQMELALAPVAKGEARDAGAEGTEVRVARVDPERPAAQARARSSFARLDRINPSNRRVRTRTHGGVGGAEPQGSPLSRSCSRQSDTLFYPLLVRTTCRGGGEGRRLSDR